MKKTRTLASAAGALVLVAGAASLALLGGGTASAAGEPSSAYGLNLTIADNAVIEETPGVVSTDGSEVTDELVDVDPLNPLLSGGAVTVLAENGHARSAVTDLGVGDGLLAQLPAELTTQLGTVCDQLAAGLDPATGAIDDNLLDTLLPGLQGALDQIADSTADSPIDLSLLGSLDISNLTDLQLDGLCKVLRGEDQLIGLGTVIAECNGDTGTTIVEDGTLLGLPLDIPTTEVNKKIEIEGLATIVGNEQIANADGTFTVNALHITLLGEIDLVVASATCGEVISDRNEPSDAPVPSPVESHVPVTG
ncbi:MAG TPA: choice-of-anchor P family protein [Nocardioides sp.]|nr:choice-of-anchor P family protein [Nocardioides sp.]